MPSLQPQFRPPPSTVMKALYSMGLGHFLGRIILLLTTTGRKTGLPRVTPLQYEEIDGAIYVASALGIKADWFRNILANPCVEVRIGLRRFQGMAETDTDPGRIADFLELRLKRHPQMVGAILKSDAQSIQIERRLRDCIKPGSVQARRFYFEIDSNNSRIKVCDSQAW